MPTLKEIGREMMIQDNRATSRPLFVIQVDTKRYVHPSDDWDGKERKEEIPEGNLCEPCLKLCESGEEFSDDCEDCDDDSFHFFKNEKEFDLHAGVFFTAKACDAHIAANSYHYNNPRSYAISVWRNPEMEAVMDFLTEKASRTEFTD